MQEMSEERIGGVVLDLSHYPGKDFYSDGSIEDEILEIVKNHSKEEYDRIILEKESWPVLYHLSSHRENIAGWIPFEGTEKVLEIGAGMGAVTGVLSEKCAEVTCVDLSRKRSLVNAYRHKDRENITIKVGNFADIEPELDRDYDYIFLIGVLEYAGSYLNAQDPFREELARVRGHLKEGSGRLVIAIENRLGLKYFAGCREDHSGRYFDGIESYMNVPSSPAVTFSRPALERMLWDCGFHMYSFYYPYPDYKFTDTVYSDRRLPDYTELSRNIRNFDRDRLLLFDERKAYRSIIGDGLYPVFANSFEIVTGPELRTVYCRFSGERDQKYRIRTTLEDASQGGAGFMPVVCKYPLEDKAKEHVERLLESGEKLSLRYGSSEGRSLDIAPCTKTADGKGTAFAFIPGRTLEEILDEALRQKDGGMILHLFDEYMERVGTREDIPVSDYDMTFSNLILQGDRWTAIDYEWEVDRSIPANELLIRAIICFVREDPARKEELFSLIPRAELLKRYGITEEEAEKLSHEEDAFQEKIAGDGLALGKIRSRIGGAVIKPAELQTKQEIEEARKKAGEIARKKQEEAYRKEMELVQLKVYFDTGRGYNEEECYVPKEYYKEEGMVTFSLQVPNKTARLRVDPASVPCIVLLKRAEIEGKDALPLFNRYKKINGTEGAGGTILYATNDPWFDFDFTKIRKKAGLQANGDKAGEVVVTFTIQMAGIPGTMSDAVAGNSR